jgi:di/tricarboxylate transporter
MQPIYWLLVGIVCIPVGLVIANKLRMDLAALLMAAVLAILQLAGYGFLAPAHSPKEAIKAFSGFSQPVVITLLSLFVITRSLDKSGITRWLARSLIRLGGNRESRLIALLVATAALLSLFMNNLAAGALLLPGAMEVARQTKIKPSKLLIPIAYGSLLGGSATYFTTANIIVSDLLRIANPPQSSLHILDFTPTGGLIAIAGIILFWLLGKRLLPDREPSSGKDLAYLTGSELEDIYQLGERLWEARLNPGSPAVGHTLSDSGIGQKWGVTIAAIRRDKEDFFLPQPSQKLNQGDILLLVGRRERIDKLKQFGLDIQAGDGDDHLSPHGVTFIEVILAPHSRVEGQTLKSVGFRQRFGLTVVALKRLNRSYRTDVGDIQLALGDSLLVVGTPQQIRAIKQSADFIVIEPNPSDQPLYIRQAVLSSGIVLAAIVASIAGFPVYLSMLIGALLTVLLGLLTMEEAYQSVEWQAIFLIAGMYAVSLAVIQVGLADFLGKSVISLVEPLGPLGLAAGAYLLTALLTQFLGGQVTAFVTGPVTISAAIRMGISPQAVAVATAIGCSASFLLPMAHPVNIIMIGPANYKFTDFLRAGWLLSIVSFMVLLVGLSVFWHL